MTSRTASSSRTLSGEIDDLEETFEGLDPLTEAPFRLLESSTPCRKRGNFEPSDGKKKDLPQECKVLRVSPRSPMNSVDPPPFWAKFEANSSFNCPSFYSSNPLDLGLLSEYCSFDDGYAVFSPKDSDRMWTPSRGGRHAIPDLFFEYGFRLPMHPFYLLVLEAFKCGLGQLAPNAILQINGVIARCHELKKTPSLDLLFSLYRIKNTGVLLYFDKKEGRVKLTDAPGSNSGWHPKWAWYEGRELDRIGPWQRLCSATVKSLNRLGSQSSDDLLVFHGSSSTYKPENFSDVDFLNSHCRKKCFYDFS